MTSSPTTTTEILYGIIKEKILEEELISVKIFGTFALFGLFAAWVFSGSMFQDVENGSYGPASIVIWSYITTIVSLGFILLIKNIIYPDNTFGIGTNISGVFVVFLMVWIVTINIKHFKKINMNVVPNDYSGYSGWSYLLLLVQFIFVFITSSDGDKSGISGNGNGNNAEAKKNTLKSLQILNNIIVFLSFILILIQQIILDHFSVDVL